MSLEKKAPQQGAFILGSIVFQNLSRHQTLGLADAVGSAEGIHGGVALAGDRLEGLTLLHLVVARSLCIGSLGGCNSEVGILIVTADTTLAAAIDATQTGSLCRLGGITVATEVVEVACYVLIVEVEHQGRVQGYATETGLEVQVRTCATACVTTETDRITSLHFLILYNQML